MLIYGIGAAQVPDKSGETINIAGLDVSELSYLNDEHGEKMRDMIGAVRRHKKVFTEKDAVSDWQKQCWELVKAPFLYFEADIIDDPEHEDAKAAKSLLKYVNAHPELPLRVGGSIEGGIIERGGADKKALSKTLGKGISLTVKPCNPVCRVFIANSLQKSDSPAVLPQKYLERLQDAALTPSFREIGLVSLQCQVEQLKKSVSSLFSQFTDLTCKSCGTGDRFFKSSSNWPNCCTHCGERFTMKDIFRAISK